MSGHPGPDNGLLSRPLWVEGLRVEGLRGLGFRVSLGGRFKGVTVKGFRV